jgi:glutamine synthetase
VEHRSPDPSCNPYLALALCLSAGIDGIKRGLKAPASVDRNIFKLTEEEKAEIGIASLPGSLGEAIELTMADEMVKATLGDHIHTKYCQAKQAEYKKYSIQVSQWELDNYLSWY